MTHMTLGVQRSTPSDPLLRGSSVVGLTVSVAVVQQLTVMIAAFASQPGVAGLASM